MVNVGLIKWLYNNGYRQKLIKIITGYAQSTISKNVNNVRPFMPSMDAINQDQMIRKKVVDRLLECRSIPTIEFCDMDRHYIKLLDYMLVDREKIRKLYFNVPQYKIAQVFRSNKWNMRSFEPQYLGITDDEWKLFLAQAA